MSLNDRIVRDPEATKITGLGRSQRYRLEKNELFPSRKKLTPHGRATGYLHSDLEKWMETRPAVTTAQSTAAPEIGSGKPGPGRGHKKPQPVAV